MEVVGNNKKTYLFILIPIFLIICIGGFLLFSHRENKNNKSDTKKKEENVTRGEFGKCPKDLSGLLTYSFVDPDTIAALIPLGNSNPPGHTFPVDHVYFVGYNEKGSMPKIAFYAPADSTITNIGSFAGNDSNGKEISSEYAITFTLCDGLTIVSAGETELLPKLKETLDNTKGDCKTIPGKHVDEATITTCNYDLNYKVKGGEQIAWTGIDVLPEVWAYNYNNKGDSNVNWDIYGYPKYEYAFCLFDLYKGDLKNKLYSKFGDYIITTTDEYGKRIETAPKNFVPRTIAPLCGQINQNIVGTVQGDWFDLSKGRENVEFSGRGIALIHDNYDPTLGKLSIGGNITSRSGVISFLPRHSGYINREFSEVKADNHIYCYEYKNTDFSEHYSLSYSNDIQQKIIMQLMDDHHLRIEAQDGSCGSNEKFINPFNYER